MPRKLAAGCRLPLVPHGPMLQQQDGKLLAYPVIGHLVQTKKLETCAKNVFAVLMWSAGVGLWCPANCLGSPCANGHQQFQEKPASSTNGGTLFGWLSERAGQPPDFSLVSRQSSESPSPSMFSCFPLV